MENSMGTKLLMTITLASAASITLGSFLLNVALGFIVAGVFGLSYAVLGAVALANEDETKTE